MGKFLGSIVKAAWVRSGKICECRRKTHDHPYGRCPRRLVWPSRGKEGQVGAWEAHHKTSQATGGEETLSNCEILCLRCHKET
ncbi:MAG: HNH endonuclease [Candidatus Bathyarchaeota archaeon]|nr:MAG: HNH endonuclease [Candidatus Bathyarchaeota archaeon]